LTSTADQPRDQLHDDHFSPGCFNFSMNANNEIQRHKDITVDGKLIEVPYHQFTRACQSSPVLRNRQAESLTIPVRDAGRNFGIHTINRFFEVFEDEVGTWDPRDPPLECESLVQLCHVFWWLKCDTSALRTSPAVKRLRGSFQWDRWATTESRCAGRLIVSLALCWEDQLAASCKELVYTSTDNQDQDNLFEGLPILACTHSSDNRTYTY
jgi:hypothetical protein